MKYSELNPGMLVKTPDGVGIVIKTGRREVACAVEGMTWEQVVLLLINHEPRWYNVNVVNLAID
tara:strand:- start:1372 stop:1563 length:192 start_codon:yes stop_codon:yes gene_type:complete